jgi:uncharacterized membrane protein YcaP (DUF421 family)
MGYYAQMSFSNFIIATALANTAQEKFYEVDLPALEDVCPGLLFCRLSILKNLWLGTTSVTQLVTLFNF